MTASFAVLSIVAISIVTQIVKNLIIPKYGATGVHIFVGILALAITGVEVAMTHYPGFSSFVLEAGAFLVSTIGTYEVVFKKIFPESSVLEQVK